MYSKKKKIVLGGNLIFCPYVSPANMRSSTTIIACSWTYAHKWPCTVVRRGPVRGGGVFLVQHIWNATEERTALALFDKMG